MEASAEPWEIAASLAQARQEWQAAQALFDTVTDPDMVDAAIHLIAAAERKYAYLLRLAKERASHRDGGQAPVDPAPPEDGAALPPPWPEPGASGRRPE